MLHEFKAFCERNSDKVIYDLLKMGVVGLIVLSIGGVGVPFFIYYLQEAWWMVGLLGAGMLVLAYLGFLLMRFLFSSRSKTETTGLVFSAGDRAISTKQATRDFPILGRSLVTFYGFRIYNSGVLPIDECQARLTRIDFPDKSAWTGSTLLCFEPESRVEQEPINSVSLPGKTERAVCLCSIKEGGVVFHSSLSMNWRGEYPFDSMFGENGDHIFHVQISGKIAETVKTQFLFTYNEGLEQSVLKTL